MATYVLLPGAGSDSWYWHLVVPRLAAAGHDLVAVDLPCTDDDAGILEYVDVTLEAIGDRTDVVLVAQSMGGFTAALVATRLPVRMVVLVAAMVPMEGETPGEWWANTGHEQARRARAVLDGLDPDDWDPSTLFLHDVPPEVAAEASSHVHDQSSTPFQRPEPMPPWPNVPTRFVLCRQDRFFPAAFLRRVVGERLGIVPDEMDGGHLPALAHPDELADLLLSFDPARARSATSAAVSDLAGGSSERCGETAVMTDAPAARHHHVHGYAIQVDIARLARAAVVAVERRRTSHPESRHP